MREIACLVLCLTLVACGRGPLRVAPDPAGPVFVTTLSPLVTPAAIARCGSVLAEQVSDPVTIVGTAPAGAENAVYMTVGEAEAPWRCLVSPEGRFPSTTFLGTVDPI